MDPSSLRKIIEEDKSKGFLPFFVNCTAGTTVIGAFDPINAIADICEEHGIWLHIDAAWGGGLLMSKTHRPARFAGVERANSLTWNPHKLMGTLLQCSTFHLREKGVLADCNTMEARYLFQQDKHYDVSYDTGDKVIQCGRHNDIFKFWLQWRAKGTSGFEFQMDRIMELTQYQMRRMREMSEKFHLIVDDPEMVNVCFWYVPERLRGVEHSRERMADLGKVTAALKSRMMYAGNLMVGYQPLDDKPNFFRSIISNQACSEEDIDFMLEELDRLGIDL
jgi:glutamate decarboxylase